MFARCLVFSMLVSFGLSYLACVTTSETNRKALILIPEAQMNLLGAQSYEEVLKKEKISKDPKLNEMISRIGKRIAKASGADFAWEFKVIDNAETVNAFCLPGGKVAVYTGILPIAKNEAALAAVMGHEVAHATLKHGAERMSQQLATQAGLAAASLSLKNSAQRDLILGGIGLGAQFGVLLPYSRKHETEADIVGLKYLAKAGYDPKESVGLWERMAKAGGKVPEIISTHPDPARRARDLEAEIPKVMALYEKSEKQPSKPL
jgi:predicted Zn-dependent protease